MTLPILRLALITATVTAALTLAGWHQVQQRRLQEASRLQTENAKLRQQISRQRQGELAKTELSESPASVGASVDHSPGKVSAEVPPSLSATRISRVPGTEYRDAGQATPIAALQTYAWACDHGDVATLRKLFCFDEAARRKTVDYMATLPAEVRAQWDSPETMAALVLMDDGIRHPYPAAAILALANTEEINEDRVALLLPDTLRARIEYQKTADGWKYAITEKMVDDYIAETAAEAQAMMKK